MAEETKKHVRQLSPYVHSLIRKGLFWLVLWYGYSYWGFGTVFLIASMLYGMATNLGERKAGEVSAYSVFNKGYTKLLGETDASALEDQIRNRSRPDADKKQAVGPLPSFANPATRPKRNDLCLCRSGAKFKKCCGRTAVDEESTSD